MNGSVEGGLVEPPAPFGGRVHVFVDEFGNKGLHVDKSGTSSFFIVTAAFVFSGLGKIEDEAKQLRQKHFQAGEMKSSSIGDNDEKRVRLLESFRSLRIKSFSIVVDKSELNPNSGLRFGKSFFKYISSLLYRRIFDAYPEADVIADRHGTEAFMLSFEAYLKAQRAERADLFFQPKFKFADSALTPLLQVADVISGSWARCYEPNLLSDRVKEISSRLLELSMGVEIWPPQRSLLVHGRSASSDFDSLVREQSLRRAALFVATSEPRADQDEAIRAQVEVLKLLIFTAQFGDDEAYISTFRIIKYLRDVGIRLHTQQLRSSVVARLRDADVLIASSKKGYKLPMRLADVQEFVRHSATIIPPMLSRLNRARSFLLLASGGRLDILADDEFLRLRGIAEADL